MSTTYPAFPVDMPKVLGKQGVVLRSPVFITITWPADDPNTATWEAFGDAIGSSSFWATATAEYGVGPSTSGPENHVHMVRSLPKTMGYYDLQNFAIASLGGPLIAVPDGGAAAASMDAGADASTSTNTSTSADPNADDGGTDPPWPVPMTAFGGVNIQMVYAIFIPASTTVIEPGTGRSLCDEGGLSFHDSTNVGGHPIAYAVILECKSQTLAQIEASASHEYVEAATDPYAEETTRRGYDGIDSDHLAWSLYTGEFGNEVADVCENWADSYYEEASPFPYSVQRSWSNASAAAGHDPCVPAPSGSYHGMTLFPSQQSSQAVNLTAAGMGVTTTRGFRAPVGQSVTFQVGFYSDGPADPWTIGYNFPQVTLDDPSFKPISNGTATVTIDKLSGQNGEMAYVTVTPTKAGALGFQKMAITWDAPTGAAATSYFPHYQPFVIFNQ